MLSTKLGRRCAVSRIAATLVCSVLEAWVGQGSLIFKIGVLGMGRKVQQNSGQNIIIITTISIASSSTIIIVLTPTP